MAVGVVKLTRRKRYLLAITIVCFLLSQTLLGLCITTWSVYVCTGVSPTLYSEKSEVSFVFTVTGMYGTHVIFYNLTGIKICQKCYAQAHKKSTRNLLFIWTLVGCNTLINLLILVVLAAKISKHISRALKHSLEKGMHNYLKDPTWKTAIDKLQVMLKCCGVAGYEDWFEFTWLDEYHLDINSNVVKEFQTSKDRIHMPVTPWSCCRTDYPMQCFHDPLQQPESQYLWKEQPGVVMESINEKGCLSMLKRPVEIAIWAFIVIVFLILLLQLITVMLSRILYTSCRNAILLGDINGIAPGWIFGRGDCGWSHGPGLYEIMDICQPSQCTIRSGIMKDVYTNRRESVASNVARSCRSLNYRDQTCSCHEEVDVGDYCFNHRCPNRQCYTCISNESDEEPVSSGEEEALLL